MKISCVVFVAAWLCPAAAFSGVGDSETPPEGPPWQRSLVEAQKLALSGDKPIFVYFTKTY